jgi:hypothetical protein
LTVTFLGHGQYSYIPFKAFILFLLTGTISIYFIHSWEESHKFRHFTTIVAIENAQVRVTGAKERDMPHPKTVLLRLARVERSPFDDCASCVWLVFQRLRCLLAYSTPRWNSDGVDM